ncbi:metal-dependent hydrolase [Paenibacillus macerans]|uniref:metal-dependent hydrolase n=1 Tax=Paenibacillus macerans TaxID=44252 RepID=UPI001BCAE404|nr:metal-dependent hydrolase [Paenibacillus macerans]
MNKKGHVALAVATGTVGLYFMADPALQSSIFPATAIVFASSVGGLAPDLDHKTSTASKHIQFPAKYRHLLRSMSVFFGVVGLVFMLLSYVGNASSTLGEWSRSAPLWLGAAVLSWLLARLRSLVLIGIGALLLSGYAIYDLHWITAFAGFAFLVLPLVSHRGVIHTPEFAAVLSGGLLSFSTQQPELIYALAFGFVLGWWAHLAGDVFGSEGIHSLLLPKLKIALHWFHNGGSAERWIARVCWGCSLLIWAMLMFQNHFVF